MQERICYKCGERKPLDKENFRYREGREDPYSNYCIDCDKKAKRKWYNSGVSCIYLIWLGVEGRYYIGSTNGFEARKGIWESYIVRGSKISDIKKQYMIPMREDYLETGFFSMRILEKCEEKRFYELERYYIISLIKKYGDIYNTLA